MFGRHSRKPTTVGMHAPRIVVDRSPLARVFQVLLILAVISIIALFVYDQGRKNAGYDSSESARHIEALADQLEELQDHEAELLLSVARLERASQIDKKATSLIKSQIGEVQDEVLAAKQELAFYRSIVSPKNTRSSVQVHSLKLRAEEGVDNIFRFKVIVLQAIGKKKVQGTVSILVEGLQGQQLQTLSQTELGMKSKTHKLSFKAFQVVEDRIRLPEGFIPQRLLVKVNRKAKKNKRTEKAFDWPL